MAFEILLSASLLAQEMRPPPSAADHPAIILKVGGSPERAIRGQVDLPPGDRKVEAALERIVTLHCHEVPFGELAQELERQLDIPVLLFKDRFLDEAETNRKVSIDIDDVPLATALEELFGSVSLTISTDDGKLTLVPGGKGDEDRTTRIYPVGQLQHVGLPRLIKIIETVTSGPWDKDEPGTGTISSFGNALVVRQTYQTHRQIELLLHLMAQAYVRPKPDKKVSSESAKPAEEKASPAESPGQPNDAAISDKQPAIELAVSDALPAPIRGSGDMPPGDRVVETALRRIVTLRCHNVSLEDLASEIEQKLKIPIRFDLVSLDDIGVDPKETVSIDARGVPLYQAISYIGSSPLEIVIDRGKLLFVAAGCDFANITRFYSVARFQALGFNRLYDLIIQNTSGPWDEDEPGTGTIKSFGNCFVIRQTAKVHHEIESLLNLVDRLDIQPLPGEEAWTNAAAVIAREGTVTGVESEKVSTPTHALMEWAALGDLGFRSSERGEKRLDASRIPPSIRFDVSAAPPNGMHGGGDLTPEEAKVETALKRIVTIRCEDVPLEEFARQVERVIEIPVRLEVGRPPEFTVDPREKISIEAYGVPLGQALSLGTDVSWIAKEGELRFVGLGRKREEARETRVYSVARFRPLGLDLLSEVIKEETSGPWHDDDPGTGTVQFKGETFVIHQTPKVHREIENLLDLLDELDIRPVPADQQVVRTPAWQGGGLGGGFFGIGESPFQKE